jgi:hypothetical protein
VITYFVNFTKWTKSYFLYYSVVSQEEFLIFWKISIYMNCNYFKFISITSIVSFNLVKIRCCYSLKIIKKSTY